MSFNNLLKSENDKPSYYKEPELENKDEEKPFTEEELSFQWRAMCNRMMKHTQFQGIATRMRNLEPVITDYPNIELAANSKMMFEEMEDIKKRIRVTLAQNLHNANIQIHIRLAEEKEIKPKLSRGALLESLQKENPAIAKLTQLLELSLS